MGLAVGRRFPWNNVVAYIAVQVLGAIVAAGLLYGIASGAPDFAIGGFAANGFGEHSPGHYSMLSALLAEGTLTFMFLMIILGATDKRAPAGLAPIAIGLGPHPDPPDRNSSHQPLGQPGAQHGTGADRGWLGSRATLAILGGSDRRCGGSGPGVSLARRRRTALGQGRPRSGVDLASTSTIGVIR